jgi:hypothetical protein
VNGIYSSWNTNHETYRDIYVAPNETPKEKPMSDLTPEQMSELYESVEAEAMADSILFTPPQLSRPFRMETKRIGSMRVSMIPGLDVAFYNRIVGLGLGAPATEAMLDDAIAMFQQAGCRNYMAQVSPLAQPAQFPEWLARRGFKPSSNWVKMVRGNQPAPAISTGLRVEKIGPDQADAFAGVLLPSFEMPPALRPLLKGFIGQPGWHHYLAFAGNKPVAAAAMFVKSDLAWLGFAGTLKKYRNRGGQGVLFARRIQDGLALGVKWFVTETGEETPENPNPSYHNMLRSGFQLAYLRRNYVHRAPLGPMREARRALLVAAYSVKFEWQRLLGR